MAQAIASKAPPCGMDASTAAFTASLASAIAIGALDASSFAISMASSISLSAGTTRDTRPIISASCASMIRPVRTRSLARPSPTTLTSLWLPAHPGMTP